MSMRFNTPVFRPQDNKGRTLPGAQLFFYENYSTTPKTTYANVALTNPNPHPIIADGAGKFTNIFLGIGDYRVILTDRKGQILWDRNDVSTNDLTEDVINDIERQLDEVLNQYRMQYLGEYGVADPELEKTFTVPNAQYVEFNGFAYWTIPGTTLPYTTDSVTYPDPASDPNLTIAPNVTFAYVDTVTNLGDSQLAGGPIYPLNSQESASTSAPNNNVPAGTVNLRDVTSGAVYKMSPIASGLITALNFTDRTATIGGVNVVLYNHQNKYTVDSFGATPGSDSTVAFQLMADTLGYVNVPFTDNPYQIDSITTTRTTIFNAIDGRANIQMITPSVLNTPAIKLEHEKSKIGNGFHFDANNTSRTAVRFDADNCSAYVTGENFNANSDSTTTVSLIEINSGGGHKFTAYAENMVNTGQSNPSTPRVVSVQDNTTSYYSAFIGGQDINVGILTFAGDGEIDVVDVTNCAANGVYHQKGKVTVGKLNYKGPNQPVASRSLNGEDSMTVNEINVYGPCSTVIGCDDSAGTLTVNVVNAYRDDAGRLPRKLFRTRDSQTLSNSCVINEVNGRFEGINFIETDDGNGEIRNLTINNVDIDWVYDNVNNIPVPSRWAYIQGVRRFNFNNWKVRIIDLNDTLGSSDFFQMLVNVSVSSDSIYRNIDVYCYESDGQTLSDFTYRGTRLNQARVYAYGVRWNTVGPYAREATYNSGVPDTINATPTTGYWREGYVLTRVPPLVVGGVGSRRIQYAFYRQTTGTGNDVQVSGISDGAAALSDWRLAEHVTGT